MLNSTSRRRAHYCMHHYIMLLLGAVITIVEVVGCL